jgi:hypothetical protein
MKRYLVALFLFGLSVSGFAHAQCSAFPCVVGSISLTDQTQAIIHAPLYTPAAAGLFRISYYLDSTPSQFGGNWGISFDWTDNLKSRIGSLVLWPTGFYSANTTGLVVYEVAGQPITYSVHASSNVGTSSYNLFMTVEQLQ